MKYLITNLNKGIKVTYEIDDDIKVKLTFDECERYTGLQIKIDEDYTSISYIDYESEKFEESVNIGNVEYFKNIYTGEVIDIDEVMDSHSNCIFTMEELADIERHEKDKIN